MCQCMHVPVSQCRGSDGLREAAVHVRVGMKSGCMCVYSVYAVWPMALGQPWRAEKVTNGEKKAVARRKE